MCKFFKRTLVCLFAVSFLATSSSLILDCMYAVRNLWQVNSVYTCTANVISVGDARDVNAVSTNHLIGRSDSDVRGLLIENQLLRLVPANISSFFQNLEAISLNNCDLEEIKREDIRGFSKLRQLHLNPNRITEIGNNLFEGNPGMKFITFTNNPIKHVAYNLFDDLTELVTLDILHGTCVSSNSNKNNILSFIFQISANCPPTFKMLLEKIQEENVQGTDLKQQIDDQVMEKIHPLSGLMNELNEKLKKAEVKIAHLEEENKSFIFLKELFGLRNVNPVEV